MVFQYFATDMLRPNCGSLNPFLNKDQQISFYSVFFLRIPKLRTTELKWYVLIDLVNGSQILYNSSMSKQHILMIKCVELERRLLLHNFFSIIHDEDVRQLIITNDASRSKRLRNLLMRNTFVYLFPFQPKISRKINVISFTSWNCYFCIQLGMP